MESIRKWFYRPKRDDTSLLAQFFFANDALTAVACELDSFDGRQEPERCTTLVNQLRHCQDKVLTICNQIMDELIPDSRANRDFRVKFPDDVMQENLAGQLWFGAECLAAGSSIMNREVESMAMRPLARALTKSLEIVRNLLREHALKGHMNLKQELFQAQNPLELEKLVESLKIFDRLFADFELCYVAAMVPVKSTKEYEQQELVCVLFSETLQRALERGLLNQADVDNYEPALMFTIPRLAIVSGLLAPPGGPLCLNATDSISEMFRPFRNLLLKIRELLWTLNNREICMLEKLLCSNEEPTVPISQSTKSTCQQDLEEFVHNFYTDYPSCKDFIVDFYTVTKNTGANMDEVANDAIDMLNETNTLVKKKPNPERMKRRKRRKKRQEMSMKYFTAQINPQNHDELANSRILTDDHVHNAVCTTTMMAATTSSMVTTTTKIFTDVSASNVDNKNDILPSSENEHKTLLSAPCRLHGYNYTIDNLTQSSDTSSRTTESDNIPSSSVPAILDNKFIDDIPTNDGAGFFSTGISQILGVSENIEIPQTQYLLNQVSHENNIGGDTRQMENSLPDIDSRKLISETNKTLSTLLLDGGECPNEVSEQTDSGICTVISSENTSLYDKSPEEKKIFANEIKDQSGTTTEPLGHNYDVVNEDPSCKIISHLSPSAEQIDHIKQIDRTEKIERSNEIERTRIIKRMRDIDEIKLMDCSVADSSCASTIECIHNLSFPVQNQPESANYENCNSRTDDIETSKNSIISQNLNGTRVEEEFIAMAYGNGQITVCSSNQSSVSMNYTDYFDNIDLNKDASTSPNEFWRDIKCKNCPSTSQGIKKIENTIAKLGGEKILTLSKSSRGHKLRTRNLRKFQKKISKRQMGEKQVHCCHPCHVRSVHLSLDTEISRSNSRDRNHGLRDNSFATSLHPNQNTRQIPNFGSHSPQRSPRLCHFESRSDTSQQNSSIRHRHHSTISSHNRISCNLSDCDDDSDSESDSTKNNPKKAIFIEKHEALLNNDIDCKTDVGGLLTIRSGSSDVIHNNCRLDCTKEQSHIDNIRLNDVASASEIPARTTGDILAETRVIMEANESTSSSIYCESSSETSEFQSDCQDDVEIALAMQAAEIANRNKIRAKFRSSEDLVHRLFVCIAGVADQLQTNFASDLRNILKCVFLMNSSQIENCHVHPTSPCQFKQCDVAVHSTQASNTSDRSAEPNSMAGENNDGGNDEDDNEDDHDTYDDGDDGDNDECDDDEDDDNDDDTYDDINVDIHDPHDDENENENEDRKVNVDADKAGNNEIDIDVGNSALTNDTTSVVTERGEECVERAPIWVPDNDAPRCMACQAGFTVVRRRHHCRNCGKVFCGRCSSNSVPLPRYGHTKPVRVCNRCFLYQVTPFTVSHITRSS